MPHSIVTVTVDALGKRFADLYDLARCVNRVTSPTGDTTFCVAPVSRRLNAVDDTRRLHCHGCQESIRRNDRTVYVANRDRDWLRSRKR